MSKSKNSFHIKNKSSKNKSLKNKINIFFKKKIYVAKKILTEK